MTDRQYRSSCPRSFSCTWSKSSRETMGGTLTGIHSDRSRYTHLPRIACLFSRVASVARVILLNYRVPAYVSFLSMALI